MITQKEPNQIDYGLSVKISVLSNDINANKGVLNAIGTTLMDGTELNNVPYIESRLQDAANSITLDTVYFLKGVE